MWWSMQNQMFSSQALPLTRQQEPHCNDTWQGKEHLNQARTLVVSRGEVRRCQPLGQEGDTPQHHVEDAPGD
jgi:hypothetical protein